MPVPVAPVYPAGFLVPSRSVESGIPVALGPLLFNAVDEFWCHWILDPDSMGEWDGTGSSTIELTKRPRSHGSTGTEAFDSHKVIPLHGTVEAPSPAALRDALGRLNAAASLDETVLAVNDAGLVRHSVVQRDDKVLYKRVNTTTAEFSLQVVAKDPRKYGAVQSYSTALPSTSGGRTYPITYPTTFTGVTTSGVISVTNDGDMPAPVWLRIDGPVPAGGWTITHLGKKRTLTFATSLALALNEFVTVDMPRREVLAMGQSARSGWVTSRGWFDLDPGVNEIAFSASVYDPDALLTLTTMPAWS